MPHKFKPLKSRYRATFSGTEGGASRLGKIDTENEVLHDVQITLEGEALGHGVWLDREFCEAVAAQGNATGDVGLKVRYGHPAMCSDAIGTELGRAKNFRVVDLERVIDGVQVKAAGVIADVHLLKSAHSVPQGDIAKHVLETAAEDPKQFGQSIVFTYADWVVKDADGKRHSYKEEVEEPLSKDEAAAHDSLIHYAREKSLADKWYEQSADGKIYAVLGKLHGTDFTDTPAATDGIFSTGTLAEEAEQMLDEHPQIMELLEKSPKSVAEFLSRTGLDKMVESARLSGLQAAKDREIAELRAQIDDLKTDIAQKTAALGAAQAEAEQLKSRLDGAEKALAESQAALKAEVERYREQVGGALRIPGASGGKGLSLVRCSFPKN
ncbi:MAG: hypothetical protein PUJ80_11545 [Verrucomicrobiota bacterium]|nr:hypothetical protein [Verrucomicrobiota bacterium]